MSLSHTFSFNTVSKYFLQTSFICSLFTSVLPLVSLAHFTATTHLILLDLAICCRALKTLISPRLSQLVYKFMSHHLLCTCNTVPRISSRLFVFVSVAFCFSFVPHLVMSSLFLNNLLPLCFTTMSHYVSEVLLSAHTLVWLL